MEEIKIHAGDFLKSTGYLTAVGLNLRTLTHPLLGEMVSLTQLQFIEIATEENVKKISGTIGWGAAGALILGPVGLLAGLLLGGKKTEVTFVAKFKDGRKLLATTSSKTYTKLLAATL